MTNLAKGEEEVIRYAALLRGVESAWQAVSYGLTSLAVFGEVGGIYINFGLWGLGLYPAWLVLRHFGKGTKSDIETRDASAAASSGVQDETKNSSDGGDVQTVAHTPQSKGIS